MINWGYLNESVENNRYTKNRAKNLRNKNFILKWAFIPYGGEFELPRPVDPAAGCWPLFYFKKSSSGNFLTINGNIVRFRIKHPSKIDFCRELSAVRKVQKNITVDQRKIAEYWGDGAATKQWTPIIDRLIDTYDLSPIQGARVLGVVQAGINDAFVITWYYKYLWGIPRPNQLDRSLLTIICTPKFPAYPSGHSVMSGTAEVILSYFFPTEANRLRELAEENAISRLYGGVHYPSDLSEGLILGRQIGDYIVNILKGQGVDRINNSPRYARLMPPPYEQAIPYVDRYPQCNLPLPDINRN